MFINIARLVNIYRNVILQQIDNSFAEKSH